MVMVLIFNGLILAMLNRILPFPNNWRIPANDIDKITIVGTAYDDQIYVAPSISQVIDVDAKGGNDKIQGGLGNDILRGGSGVDIIAGGAGMTTFTVVIMTTQYWEKTGMTP
jgi:Ca2+-binding RTX toxin-like protein